MKNYNKIKLHNDYNLCCDWCTDWEDLVLVPKGELTTRDNVYLCLHHYEELLSHFPKLYDSYKFKKQTMKL